MRKKRKKKSKTKNKKGLILRTLKTASDINQAAIGYLIPGAGQMGVLVKEAIKDGKLS